MQTSETGQTARRRASTRAREFGFFLLLNLIGFSFFSLVLDNTFWHGDDFNYLIQALRVGENWHAVFSTRLHQTFQPIPNLIFFLEFEAFGINAKAYYLFNIFVHSINAFLVYLLVRTMLKDRIIAVLSGLLFEFAVGNFGKSVMTVSGISDLVITTLTLTTMIYYIKNELEEGGALWRKNFVLCLFFFTLSLLSKTTSFSLLGLMLAFNLFYREATGRRVFDRNFVMFAGLALLVSAIKLVVQGEIPGQSDLEFNLLSLVRNYAAYLVRMVFPIHSSTLVAEAGPVVRFIYEFATGIRMIIFLCIVSYSIFGFVFGNRVIRFFIAWTYIVVTPFCFFHFPADWLDIRFLYLVSVSFQMIVASGTVLAARLLYQRPWRRRLPYLIPLVFIALSYFVVRQLDFNYEAKAVSPQLDALKAQFYELYAERTATVETLPNKR
jgi:hypothetical protein